MDIQFIAPDTLWGETSWENYHAGKCGGTESVTLHIARELRGFGHNVRILTEPDGKPEIGIGVNTVLPEGAAERIYVDSHQGWSGIPPYINGVFLRSYYHQILQRQVNYDLDIDRCFIPGNGVDVNEWEDIGEKQKDYFIWASTPERGLIHLLKLWPRIKAAKPNAELHIYYDVNRALNAWRWGVNKMSLDCQEAYLLLDKLPGVFVHGMVSRAEYLVAMKKAEYLLYTCDPQVPSELFCMTVAEAIAARVKVVIPAEIDALESLWKPYCVIISGPPISEYPHNAVNDDWVSAATTEEDIFPDPEVGRLYVLNTYSWYNVAKRYEDVLLGKEMDFGKPKLLLIPGIVEDK